VAADPESDALEGAFAQVNLQWFSSLRSRLQFTPQLAIRGRFGACHQFVPQTLALLVSLA
jgi:hypothetical protein